MEFLQEVKKLSERTVKLKEQLKTEEAIKYSLIMPFLQILGYNIFDPDEMVPEYLIEGTGEKIDYAILHNGEPSILIEVKSPDGKWEEHKEKIGKYFNSLGKARFAILTNGILYEIFSDVDECKKMDLQPFLTMSLEIIQEEIINEIKKFHKNDFNVENIIAQPVNLKYSKKTKTYLDGLFNEPSRDFIQLILKNIHGGEVNEEVLTRFETVVKDSVLEFIKDIKAPEYEVVEVKEEDVLEEEKEIVEPEAEEKPAEEKPAEEKPVEEKPVEEKPVEEKPAEEKPKEDHDEQEKKPKKRGGLGSFFGI